MLLEYGIFLTHEELALPKLPVHLLQLQAQWRWPMSFLRRAHRRKALSSKTLFVHAYSRFRFGRWESVISHFRSHPGQLSFDL